MFFHYSLLKNKTFPLSTAFTILRSFDKEMFFFFHFFSSNFSFFTDFLLIPELSMSVFYNLQVDKDF